MSKQVNARCRICKKSFKARESNPINKIKKLDFTILPVNGGHVTKYTGICARCRK